jgi:hypothetical protein
MAHLDTKPESERHTEAKTRSCLLCKTPFESEWSGERICPRSPFPAQRNQPQDRSEHPVTERLGPRSTPIRIARYGLWNMGGVDGRARKQANTRRGFGTALAARYWRASEPSAVCRRIVRSLPSGLTLMVNRIAG